MTFTLRPLGRQCIVEMDRIAEQTPGGLYIPDTEECPERYTNTGTVLACGPGARVLRDASQKKQRDHVRDTGDRYRFVPMMVQPGMRVWCGAFNGLILDDKWSGRGKQWRMMDCERDIYLIVEDEADAADAAE